MSDSDQRPEIEAPDELLADMPLPSDAKTFFLGGIFVLATLTAAYVASEIVLPMIFAIMLNLLMQPALRALERLRVPQSAGIDCAHSCRVRDDRRNWRRGFGPAETWIASCQRAFPASCSGCACHRSPILINTLKIFLFGGGGYDAHGRYGGSGLGGVLGLRLLIVVVLWLVGGLGGLNLSSPRL